MLLINFIAYSCVTENLIINKKVFLSWEKAHVYKSNISRKSNFLIIQSSYIAKYKSVQ